MISYRVATVEDIDDLVSLRIAFLQEVEKIGSTEPLDEVKNSIYSYFRDSISEKSYVSWLAIDEGKIVGTSGLSFSIVPPSFGNPTGKEAYIMNMYTIPEYRRKGIAEHLFDRILVEAKDRGTGKIRLHATPMGRSLYLKNDFEERNDEMVLFTA